jgi:ketosteroid isomerase-like protein
VTDDERLLRRAYDAFNTRDIETALALMHPDVDWPNAMDGRREHGHAAVREYWTRQFGLIDSRVEPQAFEQDGAGRTIVGIHQLVRDLSGDVIADTRVRHVYTIRDGLIERMDVLEA